MRVVRVRLGTEIIDALVVEGRENDSTIWVEILYDVTKGEDVPIENRRSGKVVKRHKDKHVVSGLGGDDSGDKKSSVIS